MLARTVHCSSVKIYLRHTDVYGCNPICGIDTAEVNGIDALKGKGVPILFVHGGGDTWIDVDSSRDMCEEAKKYAYSEIWIVQSAGHTQSRDVAGKAEYKEHIAAFLDKAGVVKREVLAEAA